MEKQFFIMGMLFGWLLDIALRYLFPYTISFWHIDGRWGWRIDRKPHGN